MLERPKRLPFEGHDSNMPLEFSHNRMISQITLPFDEFVWLQEALAVHVSVGDQVENILKWDATLKIAALHLENDTFEEKILLL